MKIFKIELNEKELNKVNLAVHLEKVATDEAALLATGQNKEKFIEMVRTLEAIQQKLCKVRNEG